MFKWGGEEIHAGGKNVLHGCAHKIILARDLLLQVEERSWVSIWFPVPQGTVDMISVDHLGI